MIGEVELPLESLDAVRDETGRAVPAKITLFRLDDEPRRDPVKGDGFIAGSPEMVLFSLYGEHQVELAQGRYQAVASRGLEYELDTVEFEVEPTTRTRLARPPSTVTVTWMVRSSRRHSLRTSG